MAPKLHPGEQVLYEGHPSWRSILAFYIQGIVVTAVICLIVAFVSGLGDGGADEGLVTIIALVGVALTILIGFVRRVATSYTITDRRLHIKRGIVSRTIQETRLERVQNVNYHQTVRPAGAPGRRRRLRHGRGRRLQLRLRGVAEPADVVHMVDQATTTAATACGDESLEGSRRAPRNARRPPAEPLLARRARRPRAGRRRGRCAPR